MNNSYEEDKSSGLNSYFYEKDLFFFDSYKSAFSKEDDHFLTDIQPRNDILNSEKEIKLERRDYYLKNIKVLALSKWLIRQLNFHLKEHYKIQQKLQKPSQTFITETNIIKNREWMTLSIKKILTKDFNEYYSKKLKLTHWEKKKEKNKKIFSILSKKHKEAYNCDFVFQRTMKDVLQEYLSSEQFIKDKSCKKTDKEKILFERYAKGDCKYQIPNLIDYFLNTPGNKKKGVLIKKTNFVEFL